jgi:ketosteroid isomerase-like protein
MLLGDASEVRGTGKRVGASAEEAKVMKRTVVMLLLIGVLAAAGGGAMGTVDQAAFRASMEKANPAYSAAMNAGDVTAYMASWDENGVQLPPDAPMVVGKPAITQGMTAAFGAVVFSDFTINMQEAVQFAPGWGYTRGTYTYSFVMKSGGPKLSYDGKFSTVWKKQADGSWKIYRDCFNSNVPKT